MVGTRGSDPVPQAVMHPVAMTTAARRSPAADRNRRGAPDPRRGAWDLRAFRGLLASKARGRRAAHRAVGRLGLEGLPGREPARGVGRGRARDGRPRRGRRGDRRRKVPAPDRRLAGDRRRHPRRHGSAQNERWLRNIAAGTTKVAFAITEADAGTNSPLDVDRAPWRATRAARPEDVHLGRRARGRRAGDRAQPPRRLARAALDRARGRGRPGFTRAAIPMPYLGPDKQWTLFFEDVELEAEP